jgi:hypothetical protein
LPSPFFEYHTAEGDTKDDRTQNHSSKLASAGVREVVGDELGEDTIIDGITQRPSEILPPLIGRRNW